jgi:uncharacterized protein YggE
MSKLALLFLTAVPLFAQLDSHTLAISASRSITPQPDQVVFGLSVDAAASTTLDQVVGALSGLGVTDANLTGISNSDPFRWSFTLVAPLSKLSTTIASLIKIEQTIGQNNSGLTLTFTIEGTQASQQVQQLPSCSDAELIADATAQAQKLAAAAGLTLGPILRVSNVPGSQTYAVPNIVERVGSFVLGDFSEFLFAAPLPSPVTCSLLVKFELLP